MGRKNQAPETSFSPPLPPSHYLVHLGAPQGSNNFLSFDTAGEERLVEVSKLLRRNKGLIVMRGDFAIINLFPIQPDEKTSRLVGEIVHIMDRSDIKEWKKAGAWPEGFGEEPAPPQEAEEAEEAEEEEEEEEQEGNESA
ncbi:hypothetical protein L198_00757 [Cryptococcus wingfieldii CBS 7118]|uniref:S1-like domain-containing protein n=1 Tax=Cryptococcus wingfieldii CBS 7118 TaxID=1295528 RepID=A0A1E3K1Y8_9TREE|nr:hypothetical protein L198_00757 [Cryptococcus wingfieldii CBS 7118]ODO07178.1 hypothetical protein L198_00757 [Cryptococcus wingfieldii CBS 7118]